jgi:hypothetical protein
MAKLTSFCAATESIYIKFWCYAILLYFLQAKCGPYMRWDTTTTSEHATGTCDSTLTQKSRQANPQPYTRSVLLVLPQAVANDAQ